MANLPGADSYTITPTVTAAIAALYPLFPAFVPARSMACSMVSVVRIPKITGTFSSMPTSAMWIRDGAIGQVRNVIRRRYGSARDYKSEWASDPAQAGGWVLYGFGAHEVDMMDGVVDGVPPIERSKYDGWVNVLYREFKTLNAIALKDRGWGKYKLLGDYAASNEAEFFAVVTERFFESPASLKHHFPELYNLLKGFYNIDTAKLCA